MIRKNIALVAHDNKKKELIEWSKQHRDSMENFDIYATGTTGRLLEQELKLPIRMLHSGPLGGDQQIGSLISEGKIDALVFFWDPLEPLPHDQDIKALLRIATVWNIPIACNRSTADLLFSTPVLLRDYDRLKPDFSEYENRKL
jgi:methylglyoxal synthase